MQKNLPKNLDLKKAQSLAQKLRQQLEQYNKLYYAGQETIADNSFDALLEQLKTLEAEYPSLILPDSPTQKVGGEPSHQFVQVHHQAPMLSLQNSYSAQELADWYDDIYDRLNQQNFSIVGELKIDGLAISLVYEHGELKRAVTRGNGLVGDQVTENAKTIHAIPLQLKQKVSAEIRAEVFLSFSQFEQLNQQQQQLGLPAYKNPRNCAAQSLRLKNPTETKNRRLDILCYDVSTGIPDSSHLENLHSLQSWGLPTVKEKVKLQGLKAMLDFVAHWQEQKTTLDFPIDGIVFKVNELPLREILGNLPHSPSWAVAYKFKAPQATSRLKAVENSVGRTGNITPVAHLEPVELLGTTVAKASLHNYEQTQKLGLRIGDYVILEKGGEIIPKIIAVDQINRPEDTQSLNPPKNCPGCQAVLFYKHYADGRPDLKELRCTNPDCPSILAEQLVHFVSDKGVDIGFLGKETVKHFFELGLIQNMADIYHLNQQREPLVQLEGFGEKSVNNLINAIESSKTQPLNRFVHGFGIHHIGEEAAKTLAWQAQTLSGLLSLTAADLKNKKNFPDFGSAMRSSALRWISNPKNQQLVQNLLASGITPQAPPPPKSRAVGRVVTHRAWLVGNFELAKTKWSNALAQKGIQVYQPTPTTRQLGFMVYGIKQPPTTAQLSEWQQQSQNYKAKLLSEHELVQLFEDEAEMLRLQQSSPIKKVVFTGSFALKTRKEWIELLQKRGVAIMNSISKSTDYLIQGEHAGSKVKKAQSLGVQVVKEADVETLFPENPECK